LQREAGSQIDGGRGLAHSTFLIDDSKNLAHGFESTGKN
jgi:hypothetical protein